MLCIRKVYWVLWVRFDFEESVFLSMSCYESSNAQEDVMGSVDKL